MCGEDVFRHDVDEERDDCEGEDDLVDEVEGNELRHGSSHGDLKDSTGQYLDTSKSCLSRSDDGFHSSEILLTMCFAGGGGAANHLVLMADCFWLGTGAGLVLKGAMAAARRVVGLIARADICRGARRAR